MREYFPHLSTSNSSGKKSKPQSLKPKSDPTPGRLSKVNDVATKYHAKAELPDPEQEEIRVWGKRGFGLGFGVWGSGLRGLGF